jgi:hypothetical protein
MRARGLDPVQTRRLRAMEPEERLRAAFGLTDLVDRLATAGASHRERPDAETDEDSG